MHSAGDTGAADRDMYEGLAGAGGARARNDDISVGLYRGLASK